MSRPPENPSIGPHLKWVSEGMLAWVLTDVPVEGPDGKMGQYWIVAECVCAAGNHARFQNKKRNYERWHRVDECYEHIRPCPTKKES